MYTNPVCLCDYSDPDVIMVNDIYYMVASSFNFTPGLPILVSKNLVDWKLVNYAAENIPISRYTYPQNAQGIWAPSFSVHNGKYYIVTGLPDDGIYITETENMLGKWSPLKQIHPGKGFIDPVLFWDDDGKAYIIHAFAKSRCGFNSKIGLMEYDPVQMKCVGEDKIIFDGTQKQPTIEGPKVYKRNGYYYIFAPAGGVADGWQSVLRSKNLQGPYEDKIVLKEGHSGINGPHQGSWVHTSCDEDWFIHFQERGIFGRIIHLEPMIWKDDWPLMGTSVKTMKSPGEPVLKYKSPKVKHRSLPALDISRNTRAFEKANLHWQWSGNHGEYFATQVGAVNTDIESFKLNILNVAAYSHDVYPVLWNSSNVLTQKICYESFYFIAELDSTTLPKGCRTGVIHQGEDYATVAVERTDRGIELIYIKSVNNELTDVRRSEKEVDRVVLPDIGDRGIRFRMDFMPFSIYSGAIQFTVTVGTIIKKFKWKSEYYSTENAHWVGGRYGLYAIGNVDGNVLYYNVKTLH